MAENGQEEIEPTPEWVTRNDDETSVVRLKKPVTIAGIEYAEVTIREPTVADLRTMDKIQGEMAKAAGLIARLSGLPVPVINKLRGADLERISEEIEHLKNA